MIRTIRRRIGPVKSISLLSIAGLALAHGNAQGEFIPEVTLTGIYSDNITLSGTGNDEDDFITELSPGFTATYDTRRMDLEATYNMQNLFYSENSERNDTFHQLDSELQLTLPRNFFLDAQARYSQQVTDAEERFVASNIPVNSNYTNVAAVSVNPYWEYEAQNGIRTLLSYNHGQVDYDEQVPGDDVVDSELNAVTFSVGTVDDRSFQWSLDYAADQASFEGRTKNQFEQAGVRLGMRVADRSVVFVSGGQEENEFEVAAGLEEPEGAFWNVGYRWNSEPDNVFEIYGGERYFGDYYGFLWEYAGQYLSLDMDFSQQLFTDAQEQLGADSFVNGQFIERNLDRPTADVYLSDRFQMDAVYDRERGDFTVWLRAENRQFQSTASEEKIRNGGFEWGWQLGSRQRLYAGMNTRRDAFVGSNREDTLHVARIGLTRELGPRTNLSFTLFRADFRSNEPDLDYIENLAALSFTRTF